MKKATISLYWLVAALVILGLGACRSTQREEAPDIHSVRSGFSWAGTYTGSIPSSGGRMISAFLILNQNDTFDLSYSYVGIPGSNVITRGKFTWDKTESNITLEVKNFPPYYRVGHNKLIQLDRKGKVVTGGQTENYVLKKTESPTGYLRF